MTFLPIPPSCFHFHLLIHFLLEYLKFARHRSGMQVYEKAIVMKVIIFVRHSLKEKKLIVNIKYQKIFLICIMANYCNCIRIKICFIVWKCTQYVPCVPKRKAHSPCGLCKPHIRACVFLYDFFMVFVLKINVEVSELPKIVHSKREVLFYR